MSTQYRLPVPVFYFWPKLAHPAARSLCDSWATCVMCYTQLLLVIFPMSAKIFPSYRKNSGSVVLLAQCDELKPLSKPLNSQRIREISHAFELLSVIIIRQLWWPATIKKILCGFTHCVCLWGCLLSENDSDELWHWPGALMSVNCVRWLAGPPWRAFYRADMTRCCDTS